MSDLTEALHPSPAGEELVRVVSQIAEGLELPVVLDRLIAAARDTTGARYAAIGVLGPDGLHEEFRHVGMPEATVARLGHLPRGHGVLGLITREQQAVVTEDIRAHPSSVGFPVGHPPMQTFLGVPLKVRGTVFGNLYLTDKPGGFDDVDRSAVQSLAAAAAVAVDNARLYRSARAREAWVAAAGEVTAALLRGLEEEEALQVVVENARSVAGADAAALALPGLDGAPVVEVADGLVAGSGLVGMSLPTVRALGDTVSCRMADGDGEPGILLLVRATGSPRFGQDDVSGAQGFAAQASLSLRLAAERRRGEDRVLLDERARIARDLHDLAVQQLFAVGIELGRLKHAVTGSTAAEQMPELVREHVDNALDGLDTAVDHIRATLRPLRPPVRPSTVSEQVRHHVRDAGAVLGFPPSLTDDVPSAVSSLLGERQVHDLLAVLAEALANVARHARASAVSVALRCEEGMLALVVDDDGVGLAGMPGRTSGVANMAARAEQYGGTFALEQRTTGGARMRWAVPLP